MTHTPGPWKVEFAKTVRERDYVRCANGSAFDGRAVASIPKHSFSWDEREANARLIAKAPEMKALLEIIARCFDPLPLENSVYYKTIMEARAIRAAIEKGE